MRSMVEMNALIVIHDNHQENNVFPLGAGYIASTLIKEGVNVQVYCMDVYHYSNTELEDYIKKNDFDLILLGFMVPRFRRTVRELCKVIEDFCGDDCWFVLGGYGPSAIPEYILSETGAKIVCVGESDRTIVDVIFARKGEKKLSDVKGIVYREKNSFITNERREKIKKLDELEFPAWDLFPMDVYTTNLKFPGMNSGDKAFPIISSRGCTDRCTFCFRLETGSRSRSPDNVVKEMKLLNEKYGVTYFYFVDELAIISKKQILKLALKIKNALPDIKYRMDCRVTVFDEEIALALKESGCAFLNIGFESSSQVVLDQMQKRVTKEQNVRAAEIACKYDIGIGLNFIWGMPGDNEKTLKENAEFIKKYNQYDQLRTIRPVTPYPGSPLYYKAIAENKLSGPEDFFEKFENSDRYMVNFMGIDDSDVYKALLEVNSELIKDHFINTDKDMNKANKMIAELERLYRDAEYFYTGPKNSADYAVSKNKYDGM